MAAFQNSTPETCGWSSDLPRFQDEDPYVIRGSLTGFVRDASAEQIRAWDDSIPLLQREAREVLTDSPSAKEFSAILEYQLPMESRRPDMIILLNGPVIVVELKGKAKPSRADLDQVAAYARDLRCYHSACATRNVIPVLVPTLSTSEETLVDGIIVVGPNGLDKIVARLAGNEVSALLHPSEFLAHEAYRPLPTLVRAARELLESKTIREIWRARAETEPAVQKISEIAHEAARTRTRHLVLVAGVPGSGKTLVGLRAVHANYLDDLAVERVDGKPSAPSVYLSGNMPLVEVLQFALRDAGGGGKTFVRHLKDYLQTHVPRSGRIPNEHLIVFDEAQRAFSSDAVRDVHPTWPDELVFSEPELFIRLGQRIPEWCVLVGLIGSGQEIHLGEEEGLSLWREAIVKCGQPDEWQVHCPPALIENFDQDSFRVASETSLSLNATLRFHLTGRVHEFVDGLLDGVAPEILKPICEELTSSEPRTLGGIRMWVSRDLDEAKGYLKERYAEDRDARFGIVASSKDKFLEKNCGVRNTFMATKNVRLGPWFTEGELSKRSCRQLHDVVTEFKCQGLELDMALLAWGEDFLRRDGAWSNQFASGYRSAVPVRNAHQLRVNAYRVLLTRGRDGTLVFVPPFQQFDETYDYLVAAGFRALSSDV